MRALTEQLYVDEVDIDEEGIAEALMDSNAIANVPKPGTSLKQPTTASGAISRGVRYSIANMVHFLWQCLGIAVPDLHTGLVHHTQNNRFTALCPRLPG